MLQGAPLQRVTRGSRTTPLQGRVCALYPVLGRKLWRSLRHMELLKYIGGSIFLVREILVSCFRHNRFYQDNPWILKWSYSLPASQRAKRCSCFWLLAHLLTWTTSWKLVNPSFRFLFPRCTGWTLDRDFLEAAVARRMLWEVGCFMSLLKEDNGSTMTDDHRFKLLGCFDCRGQFHHSRIKSHRGRRRIGT